MDDSGRAAEVVAEGVPFAEGPVWCDDGTLVVTSVAGGTVWRVWPAEGRAEVLGDTGGGPNGAAPAAGGGVVVTQNGGFDFEATGLSFPDFPPPRPAVAGLQLVSPAGEVSTLLGEGSGLRAPNDLVVAADGTIFFTDPGHYPPPDPVVGRVMALPPGGGEPRVVADGFWYCNGIALTPGGELVVVERAGLQRVATDGSGDRDWVVETLGRGGGDGFCLDADGNYYVASTIEHGVRVLSPAGEELDFLAGEKGTLTTNCCFGGADGRTLFATEAIPGRIVAWEGMPTPGLPLHPWPGPRSAPAATA